MRRLVNPDRGADTLKPAHDDAHAEVWQAKRYPGAINWSECESSLDSAIKNWQPSKVTFAFPRDFSQPLEESFQSRLVQRESAKGVEVPAWTLSDIVQRLDANEDLKVRFFGREQEDLATSVARVLAAGGELGSTTDLIARAQTLSRYADEGDPDFTYSVSSGSHTAPTPRPPRPGKSSRT